VRRDLRFYIVDVFAETKLSGNQLAVFRDCAKLTKDQMQQIAKEMHFSETTFITSDKERNGGYDIRVFTPDFELPFAGHPTLGTAYIVQSQVLAKQVPEVKLNMKVGQIPVTFSYKSGKADVLWMHQKEPSFGKELDRPTVAGVLGLKTSDVDGRFPIIAVSTGIPFVIVPLVSLKAVKAVKLDLSAATKFLKTAGGIGFLVFSEETYHEENDLNVRVLGPSPSIPEDPATGSGNGCLAAYLVKTRFFGNDSVDARVEQGYEIGRKSLLLLKAKKGGTKIDVRVGGSVQFVASGDFPRPG
jgi:trans-2,3-dihydro-3-hydroxyanthranilate isomerase